MKFVDDTTSVGLISDGNESVQGGGSGARRLVFSTNLLPNMSNTKEMVMDLRVGPGPLLVPGCA